MWEYLLNNSPWAKQVKPNGVCMKRWSVKSTRHQNAKVGHCFLSPRTVTACNLILCSLVLNKINNVWHNISIYRQYLFCFVWCVRIVSFQIAEIDTESLALIHIRKRLFLNAVYFMSYATSTLPSDPVKLYLSLVAHIRYVLWTRKQ